MNQLIKDIAIFVKTAPGFTGSTNYDTVCKEALGFTGSAKY